MKKIFKPLIMILMLISILICISIIIYILISGIPNLSTDLFELNYNSENHSIVAPLLTTFVTVVLTLIITLPIGIFTAIYTTMYSKNKKFNTLISLITEILSAIPSIVYGLFGYLCFASFLKLGYTIISGILTLSIMILPVIIRTSEQAIKSVNTLQRDASFALGVGKVTTIFKIIIPEALSGILAGIFLSTGRIIGETAALIYTMGTFVSFPNSILQSSRTLAVHMFVLSSEGLYVDKSYATAVVLLLFVIILNFISNKLANRLVGENYE